MKKLLLIPVLMMSFADPARAGGLSGYGVIACDLTVPDLNLQACACPSGKVALGGACWLYFGSGRVSAEVLSSGAYYCASTVAGDKIYVTVTCANPQ